MLFQERTGRYLGEGVKERESSALGALDSFRIDMKMNIFILYLKILLPSQPAFGYCWLPGGTEGLGV